MHEFYFLSRSLHVEHFVTIWANERTQYIIGTVQDQAYVTSGHLGSEPNRRTAMARVAGPRRQNVRRQHNWQQLLAKK